MWLPRFAFLADSRRAVQERGRHLEEQQVTKQLRPLEYPSRWLTRLRAIGSAREASGS